MIRHYDILKPESEAELGEVLRNTALGSQVLELIAKTDPDFVNRVFSMRINSIHMSSENLRGDQTLPFINGVVSEVINGAEFGIGNGKLEVLGTSQDPETDRPLRLSVSEYSESDSFDSDDNNKI